MVVVAVLLLLLLLLLLVACCKTIVRSLNGRRHFIILIHTLRLLLSSSRELAICSTVLACVLSVQFRLFGIGSTTRLG
jgi:hypothetical protein